LKFLFCFLRVQNVLYSRIGIDELGIQGKRMMSLFREYMTNTISVGNEDRLLEESKKLLFINQMLIFIAHATITHYVN